VPPGATSASVVNLMEKPEGAPLPIIADSVSVDVTPYEIQTVRIVYNPARDGLDVENASH
jgi:alpha-mannosidase